MSVWTDLDEMQQRDLETNLKYALDSSNHTDITQTILNLAEFMDHSEKVSIAIFLVETIICIYFTLFSKILLLNFSFLKEVQKNPFQGPLPVGSERLCKCAEQTRAYAKALRYTELNIREKFNRNPDPEHCRALIT